ncbi:MAG: hypothetical protein ABI051_18600 [Vicinamibacterales bacterium]
MSTQESLRRAAGVTAILVGTVCVYAIRQVDPDLYGHLAYGRYFAASGLAGIDPFAYTTSGAHWVAFEYLAQIAIWFAYAALGPAGLIVLKSIIGGTAVWLLWMSIRSTTEEPHVYLPVFVLCTVPLTRYFLFRPQLFTFVCFAAFVAVLFRTLLRHRAPLWVLPPLMLTWVNTHAGFIAGIGALGLSLLIRVSANVHQHRGSSGRPWFSDTGQLFTTLAACCAVTLATPWRLDLWRYIAAELVHGTNRRYVAEWQPVSWAREPWSAISLAAILGALTLATWSSAGRRRRVHGLPPWQWAATCAPLLAMAMLSVRHVPLAAIWSAPVISLLATSGWNAGRGQTFARLWLIVTTTAALPLVAAVLYVAEHPAPRIAVGGVLLGSRDPCRAAAFLRINHVRGNIFTPLWWGSYLTWQLSPDMRVSMDGRNISAFPDPTVLENLRFYTQQTGSDPATPLQYDTDLLLVPADAPVLAAVRQSHLWQSLYADEDAALFTRSDRPVRSNETRVPPPACSPYLQ